MSRPGRRALFFVSGYRPEVFGISRYTPQYVDALAEHGWSVDVCAPYPFYPAWKLDLSLPATSTECDGRVTVTRYAPFVPRRPSAIGRGLHEISIALRAVQMLPFRMRTADLVVAASPPPLGAWTTVRAANRAGRPSLVLAYDLAADLASDALGTAGVVVGRAFGALEAGLYARADGVIALTDAMAQRIGALGHRQEPATVIRIWADDELLADDHAARAAAFRARLEIPSDRRLIGFAGNFGSKQRLPEIVAAMATLPSSCTTVFVGDGPDRPEMERLARVGDGDVRMVPPLSTADLHAFLAACDASIVPAWTTHAGSQFPSKVANVLAAGSPIVAIADPESELGQLLARERLGVTCASLDPGDIRAAVLQQVELGRDGHQRVRCRDYALRHLDRRRAMKQFIAVVERLVTRGRRALHA